ncbi:hypothetical protein DV737_g1312, partial [Chaetothyriales sp. CBS 132003]
MARSSRRWTAPTLLLALVTILLLLATPAVTVKHHDFKRCDQSGFCKRNRALADDFTAQGSADASPYQLDANSIKFKNGVFEGEILKAISPDEKVKLPLTIALLDRGKARITIDEEKRQKGEIELRHGSVARKERFNEAASWALTGAGLQAQKSAKLATAAAKDKSRVTWGSEGEYMIVITHAPFGLEFWSGDSKQVVLNERGFLNIEHWRPKVDKPKAGDKDADGGSQAEIKAAEPEADESTWWDESFGGNTDSKPKGPESVALDISFPGYAHVYGIPEHTGPLSLRETRGGGDGNFDQPYRLYNSDVFEYELDSPMTLYGAIPFMQAHRKGSSVGVFWLNAAETWVDIIKAKHATNRQSQSLEGHLVDTKTHWMSEAGQLDLFIVLSPTPAALSEAYAELTGFTTLPAAFSLGYHQCRWNYVSDEDVKDVDRKFDKYGIPYDVIWLDIEYTEEKKYFTWDPLTFPDPTGMQQQLDETERKLVVIIDPHIKNTANYAVSDELKSQGLAVKNKKNELYEGWCWPGSSHWIDAFNPAARAWWKIRFSYDKFKGTMSNAWLWNDMNEPSVFNGPEVTMPRDNMHHGNWEHRDLHNLYGLTFHNATYHALMERKKGEVRRPFVLTRSFFAGSQRTAAMWTGDNQANWAHLAASIPMILNQGLAGFPFAGADVGGFFGNPSKELQTRWYQAGVFYPFMRGHAHIDTRRREPYVLGEPYTGIMTRALRLRYSLLPAWYTAFHEASTHGYPIVRSQYYVHPGDAAGFAIDDQLYLGSTGLLAKPVTQEGAESVEIYLADDENYYDYFDYTIYNGAGKSHRVAAPLEKLPLLMQGGHIIPRKDRPRKSSGLMKWDPYTLVVVVGKDGKATGSLYVDDGETFDYEQGAFIHRGFKLANGILSSSNLGVEGPKTARTAELTYHAAAGNKAAWATVRNPGVRIGADWKIEFGAAFAEADAKPELEAAVRAEDVTMAMVVAEEEGVTMDTAVAREEGVTMAMVVAKEEGVMMAMVVAKEEGVTMAMVVAKEEGHFDDDEVIQHAQRHSQNSGSGSNSDLFSSALSFLKQGGASGSGSGNIDQLQQNHDQVYNNSGGNQQHSASALGGAAALQALKSFTGGSSSGQGGQSALIGMAMSQASSLFDQQSSQGNVQAGASKQSVVNEAAQAALGMYLKNQGGGSGIGGLLSLASKFA